MPVVLDWSLRGSNGTLSSVTTCMPSPIMLSGTRSGGSTKGGTETEGSKKKVTFKCPICKDPIKEPFYCILRALVLLS